MCYNMYKSNKNTSLATPKGRKQEILSISPPILSNISLSQKTSYWERLLLPVKWQNWQKSMYSRSGTFVVSYSVDEKKIFSKSFGQKISKYGL